jgi:hypothetical protein
LAAFFAAGRFLAAAFFAGAFFFAAGRFAAFFAAGRFLAAAFFAGAFFFAAGRLLRWSLFGYSLLLRGWCHFPSLGLNVESIRDPECTTVVISTSVPH